MTSLHPLFVILIGTVGLMLATGCVGQFIGDKTNSENSNVTVLPEVYTAPIGGFEENRVTLEPNTTFEMNYTFYSRNWGPGEVNYSISGWLLNGSYYIDRPIQYNTVPADQAIFSIEPSSFIAKPNHSYTSKVSLVSDSLPKVFFTGVHYAGGVTGYPPVNLNISVRLGDNSTQYG